MVRKSGFKFIVSKSYVGFIDGLGGMVGLLFFCCDGCLIHDTHISAFTI